MGGQYLGLKRWLCGCMMLMVATPASAATMMTWSDCLTLARAHQPEIKIVNAQLKSAEAQLEDSYKNFFPTLSFDASHTESGTGTTYSGGSNSLGASIAKDLFTTEQDQAVVAAARADYEKTKAAARSTLADASYTLRQAFVNMAYEQANIKLLENIAGRRKANLDLVSLRFDAGREHRGSLLRNEAAYRQALSDVAQAKRAMTVARRQLSVAVGINLSSDITVDETPEPTSTVSTVDIETLAETLPDAVSARADVEGAEANLIAAKHLYRPSIGASASLSESGSSLSLTNPSWSARIGFSLPIYLDPRDQLNQMQYQAAVDIAELTYQETMQTLAYQLQSSYVSLIDAREDVDVQLNFVRAAQLRSEIATSQYTTGLLSFDNWDVIENDLIQQQKSLLSRQRDARLAAAAWEQIQGKGAL